MTKDYTKIYGKGARDIGNPTVVREAPARKERAKKPRSAGKVQRMEEYLQERLLKNEKILWKEVCNPYSIGRNRASMLIFIIFWNAIAWGCFGAFYSSGDIIALAIPGLFIIIGFVLILTPILSLNMNVLTDQRGIIINSYGGLTFKEFSIRKMKYRKKNKNRKGQGDLIFNYNPQQIDASNGFYCINDVEKVASMIAELQTS